MWGATLLTRSAHDTEFISIHAPRVGRDIVVPGREVYTDRISIHAPRVGRDPLISCERASFHAISIHAPRVGRDDAHHCVADRPVKFQSTRPVWGATAKEVTTSPFCHVFMGIPLHKYDFLGT